MESEKTQNRNTSQRQRWLVLFNCQAQGLAQSLSLLNARLDIEHHDHLSIIKHKDSLFAQLETYDRILVAPWVEAHLNINFGNGENIWRLPNFSFSGYHPDYCLLAENGNLAQGPLSGSFSAISFAAFCSGLDKRQTVSLYRTEFYEAMGYFNHWGQAKNAFLTQYKSSGFDIGQVFVEWSRNGPFTYVPAHPKIQCLRDIAKAVLMRAELAISSTQILPVDHMAGGIIFPVFPEIASRLGVQGNYLFKARGENRLMNLDEFVECSFDFYRNSKFLTPYPGSKRLIERAMTVIEETQKI